MRRRHSATFQPTVAASIDYARPLNKFSPGLFSIHGNEGITGEALKNYLAINPRGAFYRFGVWAEPVLDPKDKDKGTVLEWNWTKFDNGYQALDKALAEAKSYGCEPLGLCHAIPYGQPRWLWKEHGWYNATDKEAAMLADMFAAFLEHANHGKKGDRTYQPNLKYVEIGNEPGIDATSMAGYVKCVQAVCTRVTATFPA